MSLQSLYYLTAICVGLTATGLNLLLFFRSRPDRLKSTIKDAVRPLIERMDEMEESNASSKAQLVSQGNKLASMEAEMRHAPNREDINGLHHRITDVVRSNSRIEALQQASSQQMARVMDFLLEKKS